MEDSLDKDTSSSKKYTQQFARPISDYYLSKANKKKNDLKNLFPSSKTRFVVVREGARLSLSVYIVYIR